jgi:prevent-host-death family protein
MTKCDARWNFCRDPESVGSFWRPVIDRSRKIGYLRSDVMMNGTTAIAASEAKAKFSEIIERARKGEEFAITLHGEQVARLVPIRGPTLGDVQAAIAEMKSRRIVLNPRGKPKLRIKDLIEEGRP